MTTTDTRRATGAEAANDEVLELTDEETELVTGDLDVLIPTLDGPRRDRYVELRDAVAEGRVSSELSPALESLLELTLQTARARQRYRAEGEKVLTGLYGRTPAGRALAGHLRQVNDALRSLQDETVKSIGVRMRTVGHFTITIQTDSTSITLAARPDTIDVESVAASG